MREHSQGKGSHQRQPILFRGSIYQYPPHSQLSNLSLKRRSRTIISNCFDVWLIQNPYLTVLRHHHNRMAIDLLLERAEARESDRRYTCTKSSFRMSTLSCWGRVGTTPTEVFFWP